MTNMANIIPSGKDAQHLYIFGCREIHFAWFSVSKMDFKMVFCTGDCGTTGHRPDISGHICYGRFCHTERITKEALCIQIHRDDDDSVPFVLPFGFHTRHQKRALNNL